MRVFGLRERQREIERFFKRVCEGPVHPELGTPCHDWVGRKTKRGYGRLTFLGQKDVRAHRVAWYIEHGRWPEPAALHRCDRPSCVRVDHLFEGTHDDNMSDMHAKGRGVVPEPLRGSANPSAKLDEFAAFEMRRLASLPPPHRWSQRRLAQRFRCSQAEVWKILNGKAYA